MKRQFFSLFMVMAAFSMYTKTVEDEGVSSHATRSRKCASFWDVNTGTLTACSAVVRKNLDVQEKLNVRGDATICGDLRVKGDVIPHTIYLNPNDNLKDVINELADCGQNYQPIILSLAPGEYAAGDLNVCNAIQDLTIQGDTSPLAGVGFMQGGLYNDPGLHLQCQIRENTAIGRGDFYSVYSPDGEFTVTVTASINPDFSSVEAGTKVCFVNNAGVISEFTVASASANSITFEEDISGVNGLNEAIDSELGVGFVIKPNVTLTGSTVNRLTGPKNLKIRGVTLNWIGADEICDANEGLYLGGVKTKLELSNSVIQGIVRVAARESYNCQPNTVLQNTDAETAALIFGITSEPNFVFNSVFGDFASVRAEASKDGAFAYGQFSASTLRVVQGARLSIDASRLYNVIDQEAAILVEDGSHINWPNGVLTGDEIGTPGNDGVIIRNSSGLSTSNSECDDAPISLRGFDIAITVTQNSFAAIRGVSNPEFFDNNVDDLDLDGLTFADIDDYLSGAFGSAVSYLITD